MWLLVCWRTVQTGVTLFNVYCARALAMLERKWWEGKLSLCHDWMHWWCDKSTANKEVVMIGWCTSWCRKKLAGGRNVTIFLTGPPSRNILRFLFHPLFRYLILQLKFFYCKMFKTFSPRCTLNGYPLELNYPLFLVKVSKKHKLYSAIGFVSSQSNQETRYLSY